MELRKHTNLAVQILSQRFCSAANGGLRYGDDALL